MSFQCRLFESKRFNGITWIEAIVHVYIVGLLEALSTYCFREQCLLNLKSSDSSDIITTLQGSAGHQVLFMKHQCSAGHQAKINLDHRTRYWVRNPRLNDFEKSLKFSVRQIHVKISIIFF